VTDRDLHADAEDWGSNEDGTECEHCHGPRVVYIPCWSDGSGVLTADEIAEVLGAARVRVLEMWDKTESDGLEPMNIGFPDDVVMRIDARKNGTFRAVIIAEGGVQSQAYTLYGKGSVYQGARGWRYGLSKSRFTVQDTRPDEAEAGLLAYEGETGVLNFTKHRVEDYLTPEAREARRIRRNARDRTSSTTSWQRHMRAAPRPPEAGEDGGSS
jgi:hypothetical protein